MPPKVGDVLFEHGASLTALWVAHYRALEALEDKPLFKDPLAHAFVGEEEAKAAFDRMNDCLQDSIVMDRDKYILIEKAFFSIRHKFLDDFVSNTLGGFTRRKEPPKELQVVNIASGFDSRAFRLHFPGNTIFYELDRAEVLDYKQKKITEIEPAIRPTCSRWVCVPADLTSDNWEKVLFAKGFDPSLPSAWIMEGLTMYVPYKDLRVLLERIRAISAPGSALAADCLSTGKT